MKFTINKYYDPIKKDKYDIISTVAFIPLIVYKSTLKYFWGLFTVHKASRGSLGSFTFVSINSINKKHNN